MNKTVIRTGYGVFLLPNDVAFGFAPNNDSSNAYTIPFLGTTDGSITPADRLTNPFPNGLHPPPGAQSERPAALLWAGHCRRPSTTKSTPMPAMELRCAARDARRHGVVWLTPDRRARTCPGPISNVESDRRRILRAGQCPSAGAGAESLLRPRQVGALALPKSRVWAIAATLSPIHRL